MSKNLQVKVYAEGTTGRVDIIGSISEWGKNNAVDMRTKCQDMKNSGINSCHVYLMTVGGDCFQANEIVNILIEVFGSYTGEGGAIVASAGTYIGVNASRFTMAENGQYMIHKPMGGVFGNETEMENYLQLLKNMTVTYYDAYKAKLKKPESDFKTKWDSGDHWMTAKKAKEWGFVTDVKGSAKIDQETAQAIKNSGSPIAIANEDIITHQNSTEMELKATAISLGMDPNSTEEQVCARIAANAKKAGEYDSLKAQQEQKNKEEKANKIKALLDEKERSKCIKADARANWQSLLENDYDGTKAVLDTLQPIVKPLSAGINRSVDGKGAMYQGKTYEELQDESPETLEDLEENNPEAYASLFADWKKRNKIN